MTFTKRLAREAILPMLRGSMPPDDPIPDANWINLDPPLDPAVHMIAITSKSLR